MHKKSFSMEERKTNDKKVAHQAKYRPIVLSFQQEINDKQSVLELSKKKKKAKNKNKGKKVDRNHPIFTSVSERSQQVDSLQAKQENSQETQIQP